MEIRIGKPLPWIAVAMVIFGVTARLLPHPANLAPVGAIALFGGAVLPRKLGWWLPLAIMVVSDLFLGFYDGIWFTWLGFLLVAFLGMALRKQNNWLRIPLGAFGGSIIFFIVSNLGVWISSGMYAHTWVGLVDCYFMALPFFRNTLTGDLLYSCVLFGTYALALRFTRHPQLAD